MKQGYARRNRGSGGISWRLLQKAFPTHREHIYRIRRNQKKLVALASHLAVKFGIAGNFVYPQETVK